MVMKKSSITGLGFQPDLVGIKTSSSGTGAFFSMVKKRTNISNKFTDNKLISGDLYTSFDSDGFTVGTDDVSNKNGDVYVAYCWKMNGGSETTNDASATGIGNEDSIHHSNTT